MPTLALLDFDGTLCASHDSITRCMQQTFLRFGVDPPPLDTIAATIRRGIGIESSLRVLRFGTDATPEAVAPWIRAYREMYVTDEIQSLSYVYEGALPALEWMAYRGVPCVVVSNKSEAAVLTSLARFKLSRFISHTVCDRPGSAQKPDPSLFAREVAPRFEGARGSDAVVVGDTVTDILFARNIGARVCWAAYGYGDEAACLRLRPDCVVREPASLRDVLAMMGI